jgi:hypothetical protein
LEAERRLLAVYAAHAEEKWGVSSGTVVTYRGGRFSVIGFDKYVTGLGDKPWLIGRKFKKDGTLGLAERTLYGDWGLEKNV